jgi:hypothetical protein
VRRVTRHVPAGTGGVVVGQQPPGALGREHPEQVVPVETGIGVQLVDERLPVA